MSDSAVSDAVRERVEVASKQINAVLIWTVGMFCIMCWDWLSTLPQEITNIWRQKFTPTSYLYILNRYYGLLQFALVIPLLSGAFTGESCDHFFQWQNVGAMLSTMIVQPILALRVASLYNHHIALLVVFGLFYAAEFALMVTWLAMAWIWHPVPQAPWPCLAIEPHDWVLVVFSLHLVAYVLLLGLFIGRPQCFKAPLQSGLLSFAAIAAMNLVNVVILAATVPSLQWVNVPATIMLNIVMSCKLVLDEPWRAPESRSPYSSVKPPRFPSQATGTTAASGSKKRNSGRMIRKWGVLSKIEETSVETSGSEDRV